jgi:hypothetical protein
MCFRSHFNHGAKSDCPEDKIHVRGMDFFEEKENILWKNAVRLFPNAFR